MLELVSLSVKDGVRSALHVTGTDDLDDEQIFFAGKKLLSGARFAETQEFVGAHLHGMSRGKVGARFPKMGKDILKKFSVSAACGAGWVRFRATIGSGA